MKNHLAGLAVVGLVALSIPAHASLRVDGTSTMAGVAGSYQLIYDTDLNITWLDYTKSGDIWQNQVNWVSNLSVNVNGQNITGWRLPSTVAGPRLFSNDGSTSQGYNNNTSEMGHLYYTELLNQGYLDKSGTYQPGYGLIKTGPFANLVSSWYYWSGTEAYPYDTCWYFSTRNGYQDSDRKSAAYYALAVLPGQIPEPASVLLIGSGLAGLVGLKRRKK